MIIIFKKKKDVCKNYQLLFPQQVPGLVLRSPKGWKHSLTLAKFNGSVPVCSRHFWDGCFCLCLNLFLVEMDLPIPCLHCQVSSDFLPQSTWDVLKLTFQSADTLLLRRPSKARRPWDEGFHLDAVQSVRLEPAEHQRVVGHTLRPLG